MEEEKGSGGEPASFVTVGGRQRFTVELRQGQTTIVSWKKLVKDASKVEGPTTSAAPEPPNAHPALESRISPGQPAENEAKDVPPASRFSAVIEKIERLYMGKHSSDEEDLNDVPDDDEYDTEDSFIDDEELDEYFQVDDSAVKHDGFFVNRGKLERINEATSLANQQPKKRRRKDFSKGRGEGDDGQMPNKHVKVGKKGGNSATLFGKNSTVPSHVVALPSVGREDMTSQNQMNSSLTCAKKNPYKTKPSSDPFPSSKASNGDESLSIPEEKFIDKQKTGMAGKSSHAQRKLPKNVSASDHSVQRREKDSYHERPDLNVPVAKHSMQTMKAPLMQRKEASGAKPKSTSLDKAIRELEKMVEESRPSTMEVQDADISAQAVKRRLPREVKQKLAKVARLAQASHGKISMELVNRLMSILGHLIQLRTLKRNLKDMVIMWLSAKKEKDDRFQQMKTEAAELIRMRVPVIKCEALEQQAGVSDDFQEIGNREKEVVRRQFSMDSALEDKMADIFDLFVEGLDEDGATQVRKLYKELAKLWPDGYMDNHGIKRAIIKAKDRKKSLYSQHKEKIKKSSLIPKTEEPLRVETSSISLPHTQEKLVTDSSNHSLTSLGRPLPNAIAANTTIRMPGTVTNGINLDRPKQEKVKGSSSNPNDMRAPDALPKKKVKRKPDLELGEAHIHSVKLSSAQGDERHKSQKHVGAPLQKPSLPLAAAVPPNFEQPS